MGARARVYENWERLVRATLQREQLRSAGQGAGRATTGLAGAVPPSLVSTNIDQILQAADDIEDEDPNVARILCEQAYTMAQNLDPSSEGRGVLQFKTGLMSVIKQKLAKKGGTRIDRQRDIEHLWNFYLSYKKHHRVDDIQREQERWRESGTFSTEFKTRAVEMRKIYATLRALIDVLELLVGDSANDKMGELIMEEVRKIKGSDATLRGELAQYNNVPLDALSLTNAISFVPEVRAAISAIGYTSDFPRLPAEFDVPQLRSPDMFDLLEFVFGFQRDNIWNQRENVVLTIANAQARLGLPVEAEPKIDEKAITEVFRKVLDNYIKWCRYLGIRIVWNSLETLNKNRKLILISLYFLIWGEAANVRFLPECICYIFHNMAKELDAILDSPEAIPAKSCTGSDGPVSYLREIIFPIYETMEAEADRNNNGQAAHSAWRNYDDFNEYFWSPSCFELGWPPRKESSFLQKPKKTWKRTGKSSFVEHRTFLHLYRSFHRLWIFLFLMFQGLTIIAFHHGDINLNTFKVVLSTGPAFFILNFLETCLDVLLMFGAYSTARGFAISRLIIRFFWFGVSSAFVTYLYWKVLGERNNSNSDSTYFRLYILVLGVYVAIHIAFALLVRIPACHKLSDVSDRWPFFQFFKWIYQERYYVGRGLFEKTSDYARYVLFWLVIFVCKFTFAYYLQIKPLIQPTKIIVELHDLKYSWHDLVSRGNKNALTVLSLWAPVVAIYPLDILIWYMLLYALIGGLIGARARLGEIRSLEMLHKRFESFPEAFVKNLVSSVTRMPQGTQFIQDLAMEKHGESSASNLLGVLWRFLRKCLFFVLSFGPMPNHIAFIMDGNRRYAKKRSVKQGSGHKVGFTALTSVLQYCYEMGVNYVTVYAFSIDNFKRQPDEVQSLMDLMKEKIDELLKEGSLVNKYRVRINFWGNLGLLSEPVRLAAEKAMESTARNMGPVFSVCVAYTSTNEIMHAVEEACVEKRDRIWKEYGNGYKDKSVRVDNMDSVISVTDLEQHLYTSDCPDPDIVIRTSGETRLSNFFLWQTTFSHLQNPVPLWPEFSFRHLIWAILEYQRVYPYLQQRRSSSKKKL